ncbi:MAG: lipoyl(octanoyl) transferase LipB [Candidatus Omnitrophica bacterium]|nr:lipoyl(octanoyl) transferase LipB [Candidatus Omnitrophota bacterium]
MTRRFFEILDLGITDYNKSYSLQKDVINKIRMGISKETLILTEHFPVITIGRQGSLRNLLVSEDRLKDLEIKLITADRGGDITLHSPGQLILYPILNLKRWGRDLHLHLRKLEEVMITFLSYYGIDGIRMPGATGVWLDKTKKIGSIGIGVTKWITYHGLSININNDLQYFDLINPCGLRKTSMVSVSEALGKKRDIGEAKEFLVKSFIKIYDNPISALAKKEIYKYC